jgi:hypothetical protein
MIRRLIYTARLWLDRDFGYTLRSAWRHAGHITGKLSC